MSVKAVTFDLWDTMVHDDSDEIRRALQGLRSKRDERRHLMWQALSEEAPIDLQRVVLAYDTADAGFNLVWKENHINWTLEQRLRVVLSGLGRTLAPERMARLVEDTGRMEVDIPPDAIDGISEALEKLSTKYKLAVVSDAIVTPGTGLREILQVYDLKKYFSAFAFSDEVGHSKPHRSMFDTVADQIGIEVSEIIHVGDRDSNDVKGPQRLGAKGILFIGSRAVEKDNTSADAICERLQDLPAIVDQLAGDKKKPQREG